MKKFFFAFLFLPALATAQSKTAEPGTFVPAMTEDAKPPVIVPEVYPNPWRINYFGEYQGPALGNFDIGRTQYPAHAQTYTEWDHYLKIGYALSKFVTVGTQFRAYHSTDPAVGFGFYDQRFYVQWNHMIDTSDIDIAGKFTVQPPTTDSSRNSGEIISFRLNANVELKTSLRSWFFTCDFLVQPYFYNNPAIGSGKTDLYVAALPFITVTLAPNLALLFEGEFDANHNYNDAFYDYQSAYNDYLDIGPLITINSHLKTNLALRFFTDNVSFKAAALYANIGVAL